MTKIREKNTNWYATILGFFRDEDTENEQDSGYEEWKKENQLEIDIEADGGINLITAPKVKEAGANILVAGTAILIAKDYKIIIDELKQ